MMRLAIMLALSVCAFVNASQAQQSGRRATPTLTSEDLLDRPSSYSPLQNVTGISRSSASAATTVGGLYRDPAGAFSFNLPSGNWSVNTRSQGKGRLSDLRVFRKLEADGFASATASVYVISANAGLPVEQAARLEVESRRALAEALAARFLSSSSSIISADASASNAHAGFQVVADQMVSRRPVVRALIYAFEHRGKLYVVVCRAAVEAFDAQAREFSTITQSLASSVARSS